MRSKQPIRILVGALLAGSVIANVVLGVKLATEVGPLKAASNPTEAGPLPGRSQSRSTEPEQRQLAAENRRLREKLKSESRRYDPVHRRSSLEKGVRAVPPEYVRILLKSLEYRNPKLGKEVRSDRSGYLGEGLRFGTGVNPVCADILRLQPDEEQALAEKLTEVRREMLNRIKTRHETVNDPDAIVTKRVPFEVVRFEDLFDDIVQFVTETIGEERAALVADLIPGDSSLLFEDGPVEVSVLRDPEQGVVRRVVYHQSDGTKRVRDLGDSSISRYAILVQEEFLAERARYRGEQRKAKPAQYQNK